MNKKAIFMITFSFFVLIFLSTAYYLLVIRGFNDQYGIIGENQAGIVEAYNKGEEYLLNADYAIKYSSYIAIDKFTKNSGINANCNNAWKFNSECNPDLEKNFIDTFKLALKDYGYNAKNVKIEKNTLIVTLDDFNHEKSINNFKLNYNLPATLKQELAIDLDKLLKLREDIKKCIQDGKDLNTCTNEKTKVEGDLVVFDIESNKNIIVFTNKLETKKPGFVFKINSKDPGLAKEEKAF